MDGDQRMRLEMEAPAGEVAMPQEAKAKHKRIDRGHKRVELAKRWLIKVPFVLHAALVLTLIWIMSLAGMNYLLIYVIGFIFLLQVETRHSEKSRRRIRHEERKTAAKKQLLSDFETVHWLNEILEKAWPAFLENFASETFLGPLMPFFIAKYKPWTVQDATLLNFSLGRTPPVFTGLRIVDQLTTDDNMVIEATMEFVAADDMIAVLSVQLKKRLGALWTKLHISNLHIEGKVRIGVKFLGGWPFIGRLRASFENVPYLQITARPVTNLGVDVAELPGIATWLDTMLMDALEDSIVKPNMLVINVERLASTWSGLPVPNSPNDLFHVALAVIEVLEGTQLKAADANGLSDPFVKGFLNKNRFKTLVKRRTLNPKWREEFRLPVRSWDEPNRLFLRVRDKDLFRDDNLGFCEVHLSKFRGGNRQEVSLPLKGVKTGRLHLAITVEETPPSDESQRGSANEEEEASEMEEEPELPDTDQYEPIEIPGGPSGIFSILRPGKRVQRKWRRRKGRKVLDSIDVLPDTLFSGTLEPELICSDSDEENRGDKSGGRKFWRWSRGSKDKKTISGELLQLGDNGRVKVRTVLEGVGQPNDEGVPGRDEQEATRKPDNVKVDTPCSEKKGEDDSPVSGAIEEDLAVEAGRRSMKDRAKGVVKHAEKTATHIGHSLFRKRSVNRSKNGESVDEDASVSSGNFGEPSPESETPK